MNVELVNVGSASVPGWLVLVAIGALLMYAFGLWSVVWEWGKAVGETIAGKEATGGIVDAIDDFMLGAKSFKVQQALRIARIEFKQRSDTDSTEALDLLISKASVWPDTEDEE